MLTTLAELYASIEAVDPDRPEAIGMLRYIHESYTAADPGELKNALRIELNSLTAWLNDGSWLMTMYGVQATHLAADLPYLDERIAATTNTYLKVGYAFGLWQLQRRPVRARVAVDTALAFLAEVETSLHAGDVARSSFILPLLESAFLMCGRSGDNHRRPELIEVVKRIALDPEAALDCRRNMIATAIRRRTDFDLAALATLLPAAEHILSESYRGGVAFIIESARAARQLATRAGVPDADI